MWWCLDSCYGLFPKWGKKLWGLVNDPCQSTRLLGLHNICPACANVTIYESLYDLLFTTLVSEQGRCMEVLSRKLPRLSMMSYEQHGIILFWIIYNSLLDLFSQLWLINEHNSLDNRLLLSIQCCIHFLSCAECSKGQLIRSTQAPIWLWNT